MLLYCEEELQSQSAFGRPRSRWHAWTEDWSCGARGACGA